MFRKLILIFFLFLFCGSRAFADTFVVTSNADSGPGTLREALTLAAANGSAVKDYINFNLPGANEQARTILIKSKLPEINSDLVVDGSTQPGSALSINGAKVVISGFNQTDYAAAPSVFYLNNVSRFELYGIIIKNIHLNFNDQAAPFGGQSAILVGGKNGHIIIGSPGKGNVIYNVSNGIQGIGKENNLNLPPSQTDVIELKNNLIGIAEDGIKIGKFRQSINHLPYVYQIIIGGDTKEEGNTIFDALSIIPAGSGEDLKEDVHVKIKNNVFSANALQQRTTDPDINTDRNLQALTIGVDPNRSYSKNATIDISNNVLGYTLYITGFEDLNLTIQSNFFGTSSDQINKIPVGGEAITLAYIKGKTLIGGNDNIKGNVFTNCVQDIRAINFGEATVNVTEPGQYLSPRNLVELSHNSFYCNNNAPFVYHIAPDKKPLEVTIDQLTTTSVNGTTKPNAKVELFYTDKECTNCQPKTYIATAYANANGNWVYNGSLLSGYGVMAGATLNNVSSEFTDTRIYYSPNYAIITPAECSFGGSIIGLYTVNAKKIEWVDANGNVTGTNINLTNARPGKYRLKAEQFGCVIYSDTFEIPDYSPFIDDQLIHKINPACGIGGSITGLYAGYGYKPKWRNAKGLLVGEQFDISNLSAGSYTLQVTGQRGCVKTYGPVILTNTSGSNIDESTKAIQSTPCGQSIGSITNITVTGTNLKYSWKNEQGQEVATTKDLIGKPAGKYNLQVTDDTPCGPVYSSQIEIPETNGITLNIPSNPKTDASCNKANGSITGITAPGATKFEWRDANNNLVGNNPDLKNVPAGAYRLTASNDFGCSKTSQVYQILELPGTTYSTYTITRKNTCFGETNGSISVTADAKVKSLRWVNGLNQTISGNQQISGLAAGTYKLYFTDQNDCESLYNSYTINEIPQLQIIPNTEQKTNDECDLKTGSIKNIQVTGGLQPYVYEWYNANNEQVSTGISPTGLSAGNYKLIVNDASGCAEAIANYSITAHSSIIAAPSANDVQLCTSGNALLTVNSAVAGYTYRLYESVNSITPLAQQANGRFTINAKTSTAFYISQVSGGCESSRTKVQVTISLSAIHIANAFTPNGDGINDYWKIEGIENYPNAQIQIFNRYGQKLFESKGYPVPFNGTSKGSLLANGAYYYIINLNKNCSLLSGYLSIIR